MLFTSSRADRLQQVAREVRLAPTFTPALFARVIAAACTRLPMLDKAGKAAWIDQFVKAGAWNDAVFALVELELPYWRLRRLVYDGGDWFCSLSRHMNVPVELDDSADANHEVLLLAVLSAFLEACHRTDDEHPSGRADLGRTKASSHHVEEVEFRKL